MAIKHEGSAFEGLSVESVRASVHVGPKGGVEYRLWTERGTFHVVGRFKALPHMSPEERAKADSMEATRKASTQAKAASEQVWREIRRGG